MAERKVDSIYTEQEIHSHRLLWDAALPAIRGLISNYGKSLYEVVKKNGVPNVSIQAVEKIAELTDQDFYVRSVIKTDGKLKGLKFFAEFDEARKNLELLIDPAGTIKISLDKGVTYRNAAGSDITKPDGKMNLPTVPELNILNHVFGNLSRVYQPLAPQFMGQEIFSQLNYPSIYHPLKAKRIEHMQQNAQQILLNQGFAIDPKAIFISQVGDGYIRVSDNHATADLWVSADGGFKLNLEPKPAPFTVVVPEVKKEKIEYKDSLQEIKNHDREPIAEWRLKERRITEAHTVDNAPVIFEKQLVFSIKDQVQILIKDAFGVSVRKNDILCDKGDKGEYVISFRNFNKAIQTTIKVSKFGGWEVEGGKSENILEYLNDVLREGNPEGFKNSKFSNSEFIRRHIAFMVKELRSIVSAKLEERGIKADRKTLARMASNFDFSADGKTLELRYKNHKGESLKRKIKDDKDFTNIIFDIYKDEKKQFIDRKGEGLENFKKGVKRTLKEASLYKDWAAFVSGAASVTLLNHFLITKNPDACIAINNCLQATRSAGIILGGAIASIHPGVYMLEKWFGKGAKDNSWIKAVKQVSSTLSMFGLGAIVGQMISPVLETSVNTSHNGHLGHQSNDEEKPENNFNTVNGTSGSQEGVGETQTFEPQNPEGSNTVFVNEIHSDYELWHSVRDGWMGEVSDHNWTTKDADLGWYLTDQTFEFLKANGVENLYTVDYSDLAKYLTDDQVKFLIDASKTETYNDLNNLRIQTPNLY